jgi:AhpD family alkylhydroperoxidase
MPRLRYIDDSEQTPHTRELIESAKRTGAPDPRVVSLMTRSKLGIAWVEYWNKLLYQGVLPHKLKEMCRIKISVAHQCGYCSTVRSNVAKAEGLTESMINDLFDYAGSSQFSAREKAALRYADLFKQGEHAIDKDEVYAELARHFSDEEIIELGLFCAEVDGVGKFVKSLNVLSWEEACELNPRLSAASPPRRRCGIITDQFAASRFVGAGFQRSAALSSLALASTQILSAVLPPGFSTCFQNGARVLR